MSPGLWLPTLALFRSIVATVMSTMQNMAGFFVVRFSVGTMESGLLFPCKCVRRDISPGGCKDDGCRAFEWVALDPYLGWNLTVLVLLVAYFS
jgi:hypothetical protein